MLLLPTPFFPTPATESIRLSHYSELFIRATYTFTSAHAQAYQGLIAALLVSAALFLVVDVLLALSPRLRRTAVVLFFFTALECILPFVPSFPSDAAIPLAYTLVISFPMVCHLCRLFCLPSGVLKTLVAAFPPLMLYIPHVIFSFMLSIVLLKTR